MLVMAEVTMLVMAEVTKIEATFLSLVSAFRPKPWTEVIAEDGSQK
jgi:hypothetical protein